MNSDGKIYKLNQQGLSRRCESFMRCLRASPGNTLISIDISAGEPTVVAHYSRDPNYVQATFGMVGKQPYYDTSNRLIIDDIYLTLASCFPLWAKTIWEAFNTTYDGISFAETWVKDQSKLLKGELKNIRTISKGNSLGILYGMGAKKMSDQIAKAGLELSVKDAKAFRKLYYDLFPNIRKLANKLETLYNYQGFLQNDFGYVVYPSADYKVLNALIQSTVSGIIATLVKLFIEPNPWIKFVSIIHDEIIIEVEDKLLNQAKLVFKESVEKLNQMLNWSVPLRFGWVEGKDFYEAK